MRNVKRFHQINGLFLSGQSSCVLNDDFSIITKTAWIESLIKCVGRPTEKHPIKRCKIWFNEEANNKTEVKDSIACYRDFCTACCKTFPGFDVIHESYRNKNKYDPIGANQSDSLE